MKYSSTTFIVLIFAFALGCTNKKEIQTQARPNVLFISIDDLNDWTGALGGHPQAITPNMDRLFEQGYCLPMPMLLSPCVLPRAIHCSAGYIPALQDGMVLLPRWENPLIR